MLSLELLFLKGRGEAGYLESKFLLQANSQKLLFATLRGFNFILRITRSHKVLYAGKSRDYSQDFSRLFWLGCGEWA